MEASRKVKLGNKVPSDTRNLIRVMSERWRMSLHTIMVQNAIHICIKFMGERNFILFDRIHVSTIELHKRRFQTCHVIYILTILVSNGCVGTCICLHECMLEQICGCIRVQNIQVCSKLHKFPLVKGDDTSAFSSYHFNRKPQNI